MQKYNLMGDSLEVYEFVKAVTALAIKDWTDNRQIKRSGNELCEMFTTQCRKGHTRMATGIYNNVRWTLDTNWK